MLSYIALILKECSLVHEKDFFLDDNILFFKDTVIRFYIYDDRLMYVFQDINTLKHLFYMSFEKNEMNLILKSEDLQEL